MKLTLAGRGCPASRGHVHRRDSEMSDSDAEEAESAGKDQDWEDWEEDCQAPTRSFSLSSRFYFVFPSILLSIDLVLSEIFCITINSTNLQKYASSTAHQSMYRHP